MTFKYTKPELAALFRSTGYDPDCSCLQCQEEREYRAQKPSPSKLTGGSSAYYKVAVINPTTPGAQPYTAECNDIIEALGMNYAEGNAFKALWRMAAQRQGGGKPGTTRLYDAEKVEFFGRRLVATEKGSAS